MTQLAAELPHGLLQTELTQHVLRPIDGVSCRAQTLKR